MPIIEGQRFGRLVVMSSIPVRDDPKHPKFHCRCDCGKETLVQSDNFARTRSCGCLRIEQLRARSITHGMTHTKEYRAWAEMLTRCSRTRADTFDNYKGRGITVCARWLASFENFFSDMGQKPSLKHTLDRIDNNGGYSPENCRWVTRKTQRVNQRRMTLYSYGGVTGTLKDLAAHVGFSYTAVRQRVSLMGWPIEKALTVPVRPKSLI